MTTPLEVYAAPGSARPGMWRLFVGIALVVAGWLGWTVVVMSAFVLYKLAGGQSVREALSALSQFLEPTSPASVIFQLATFAGIWPATWAAVRLLHRQPFGTLFSPEGRMRWGDFGRGVMLAAGFWVITMAFGLAVVGVPERTDLPLTAWAMAFAPLAVMVFFQASGEELVFRGYFLQQLAARWRSPLIWAALPAFLFGLAHYSSGAEQGIGWIKKWGSITVFDRDLGDLTYPPSGDDGNGPDETDETDNADTGDEAESQPGDPSADPDDEADSDPDAGDGD